ncbi:DoxX family protein [Microbacterium sp. ASV49]|uniref:DoxX family protein n=1 Tax=Microbacterium candidum TaxID=3041922 RepID=A0ABT7MTX8_9MICO|nr:DoxX family protein [Microbacterium sp. ASV49]MDL9977896.1 DoxX family protein [Microbacterium sp. ASV49]
MVMALWIVNIVTAIGFLGTGSLKAFVPKPTLRARGIAWTDDFSAPTIRLLGVAELAGAVGLIVPMATGILPVLTPIAAVCLAAITAGAVTVHVRRKEGFAPALVMCTLSIASAVLGFIVLL